MRKFAIVLTSLSSLGLAASAQAQGPSVGDLAAYTALSVTPVGAMTPVVTSSMLGRVPQGYSFAGQYGHLSDNGTSVNSFGATASMPLSGIQVGGSFGFVSPSSNTGLKSNMMLGLNAESNLGAWALTQGKDANLFTLGLRGDFGWANPDDGAGSTATALSFAAGAPVALVLKSGDLTWAPFVTPGFGWGRLGENGVSESGTRFMMGAGLGMSHRNGWGVSVGMQKVFIDQGKSVFGLNVSYGR